METDWDKEVTITLTVKELYIAHQCMESVDWMGEICEFIFAQYEPLTPERRLDIVRAMYPFYVAWCHAHDREPQRERP